MTIMHPNRLINTFTLASSDVYFILASYPHYIEVLDKKIHFLIFFDQPMPKDVGFRQAGVVWDREVLAAAFGLGKTDLPQLPFEVEDPLLVAKKNPLDRVSKL